MQAFQAPAIHNESRLPSEVALPNRQADRDETTTAPVDAYIHASKIPPWNPFERYWSNKNTLPDYGKPKAATMMKRLNRIWYGNKLEGQPTPPPPQATMAKRTGDGPSTKPPKRQRIENDANHDAYSVPSSSEVADQPHKAGSSYRKGAEDSQSVRSSGNRRSSGVEVCELRSIERTTGLGKKRSRHKAGNRPSNGSLDDGLGHLRKTTNSSAYNSKRSLQHIRNELSSDPVQDDAEVTLLEESGTNGRAVSRVSGKTPHTSSMFAAIPKPDESSEDELSAPLPSVSQPQPAKQNQRPPEEQANTGRKRAAEVDEDERKRIHVAKRRPEISSRADMQRTQFSSKTMHTQGGCEALRINKAVCGPTYVYPANGIMYENMPGASNRPCHLVAVNTYGKWLFDAVDDTGKVIPELKWMTPNIATIKKITSNPNSAIVQITKSLDHAPTLHTGSVLYVMFGTSQDAKNYIRLCCEANDKIHNDNGTLEIVDLSNAMNRIVEQIMNNNKRKPPQPSTTKYADDIRLLERRRDAERNLSARLPPLQDQQTKTTTRIKPLRDQMKDDVTLRDDAVRSTNEPKPILTSAQERHLRDVVEDEYDSGHQQHSHDTAQTNSGTHSRLDGHGPSQRSLRSTRQTARSPSPVLERWTKNHRDWAREWKTDLVYERTTVGKGDIERLDEGQLLNDEIIFFYIKYLHKELEKKDEQLANKVYVFNSFFWDKLKPKKGEINYDGVKNWTAKIDLLSFDYIIVPINENAHWYLAIICNAKGLLVKEEPDTEKELAAPEEDRGHVGGGDQSMADGSLTRIAVDVSLISIDDDSVDLTANPPRDNDKPSAAKNSKPSKKGTGPRKYDPRAPKVITLDSLGGPHSSVVTALKIYLCKEIKHKKGLEVKVPGAFGTHARDIPCQPNFTDCGVYLLGYMQEFMKDPDRFTKRILQSEKRDWDVNAPALRSEIRELIFRLQKDYQDGEENKRRQKALASRKQPLKPQNSGTTSAKNPAQVASEQPTEQSPMSASASDAQSRQETSPVAKISPFRNANKKAVPAQRDIHSSPPQAADDGQETGLSQSQPNGPDTVGNRNNDSMIVNCSESMEMRDTESVSASRAKPQQIVKSIEGDGQKQTPAPSRPSGSQQTSHSLGAKAPTPDPVVYDQRFLEPILSSPARSDTANNKGDTPRGGGSPGKTVENKSYVKSHYFQNATREVRSTRQHGSAKGKVIKREGIPSSDKEGDGAKPDGKKPSPTIDLTSE